MNLSKYNKSVSFCYLSSTEGTIEPKTEAISIQAVLAKGKINFFKIITYVPLKKNKGLKNYLWENIHSNCSE